MYTKMLYGIDVVIKKMIKIDRGRYKRNSTGFKCERLKEKEIRYLHVYETVRTVNYNGPVL